MDYNTQSQDQTERNFKIKNTFLVNKKTFDSINDIGDS